MIEKKLHELKTKILRTQNINDTMREELANDIFEIEKLAIVSKSVAKQYAEFCVVCR